MSTPTHEVDLNLSRNHSSDTQPTRRSNQSYSRSCEREGRGRQGDRDSSERYVGRSHLERERTQTRGRPQRDRHFTDADNHYRERAENRLRGGECDDKDREKRRKREEGSDVSECRDYQGRSKKKRSTESVNNSVIPRSEFRERSLDRSFHRSDHSHDRRSDVAARLHLSHGEHDEVASGRSNRTVITGHSMAHDDLNIKSTQRRPSPSYGAHNEYNPEEPREDDSEARSVFVSQLAARLTARDLGYFFEDKLGEGTVMDSRIVTDRLSRRSKGIGYVEFRSIDFVEKAISLSGTVVMGLPIMVQLTESERNKLHPGDGNLNLPPGVSAPHGAMQLYVGSLHFNLTESDIKQVFEPFGELEFVDLHRDPMTGRSKGYAFVQYKKAEDARMALEQMEGFELAGRTLRVNTVHEKGTTRYTQQDSLDESGGGNLNAASRQALMHKLARIEPIQKAPEISKPSVVQSMQSRSVLLKNMFDPEEETEHDWATDLAYDVKSECDNKYGKVEGIKVEKETQGEIYMKFDSIESAKNAIQGLNGRWFGGRQVSAAFISDAIMQAHQ